jgi:hypothetical protein
MRQTNANYSPRRLHEQDHSAITGRFVCVSTPDFGAPVA